MLTLQQPGHMLTFSGWQETVLTGGAAGRLLLAACLGGAIGIDREYHHRPSGLRTNLLICFGAALFTFLSSVVAGEGSSNKAQIASNIVQGIGFLGAGLILRNGEDRISGLTSAATVWAVASIGMACGAGLYILSVFSTVLVLVALEGVGFFERTVNLKLYSVIYETRGHDAAQMSLAILHVMDDAERRLIDLRQDIMGELIRLSFSVSTSRRGHQRILAELDGYSAIEKVLTFRDPEED